MSWAKFDDQYPDHPKIVEVGPLGMALHTAATCYCARYLTDGFVPAAMIGRLINFDGINVGNNAVTNKQITDELTRVGLLEIVPGGYKVHDYLEYNPPAEQVKAERAANRARQDRWKKNNGVTNGVNNAAPSPSPNPIEEELKKGVDPFVDRILNLVHTPFSSGDEVDELQAIHNQRPDAFWPMMEWIGTTEPNSMKKVIRQAGTAIKGWTTIKPNGNGNKPRKLVNTLYNVDNTMTKIYDDGTEERCPIQ